MEIFYPTQFIVIISTWLEMSSSSMNNGHSQQRCQCEEIMKSKISHSEKDPYIQSMGNVIIGKLVIMF